MTSPTLHLKEGDVVAIANKAIGVIRYIGFVNNLSNGRYDRYIGVEIKFQSDNTSIGIPTNGEYTGYCYFNVKHEGKGRFVQEHNITKQFSPEQLFDFISNKASLLPDPNQIVPKPPEPSKPKSSPSKPVVKPSKPTPKPKPKQTTNTPIHLDGDLSIFAKRLTPFCTKQEITVLTEFCKDQEFTALDDICEDLTTIDDSMIVDAMKDEFAWNQDKIQAFVDLALNKVRVTTTKPNLDTIKTEKKENDDTQLTTQWKLPLITDFIVPQSIMKQKDPRSINDIEMCLKKNKIPQKAVSRFREFCKSNEYSFLDLQHDLDEIREEFKQENADLIVFMDYIEKCLWELAPPSFRAVTFTKKDEEKKYKYFEQQCKGAIRHDRELLQYFCITQHTEKGLPSQLIDIADRCAIEEKQELNRERFGKKYFFKYCDNKQIKIVKEGLRKYHNRFLPLFPKNPLRLIADKVSGYQKYCILLSYIVSDINKQISTDRLLIPYMIDMMIIPPGCFNTIVDNFGKQYDPSGPMNLGDIKKRFREFDIDCHETLGLTDKSKNFDPAITQRITKKVVQLIKKITNNFTKTNQRICIVIDRRWRIHCKKFDAFTKLRKELQLEGSGTIQTKKASKGWGITKGWFDGTSNDDSKGSSSNDFYNNKHDTIYVYQPLLKKTQPSTSYHEFKEDYCHETLIYLTKQCIIPQKGSYYGHIGGDSRDGWFFTISAHIQTPANTLWYNYDQRWYLFLQAAALRFFPKDMHNLWPKYFVDPDEDTEKLTLDGIKKLFGINLEETDSSYKRWYYAIKRSD